MIKSNLKIWGTTLCLLSGFLVAFAHTEYLKIEVNIEGSTPYDYNNRRVAELTLKSHNLTINQRVVKGEEIPFVVVPAGTAFDVCADTYHGYHYKNWEQKGNVLTVNFNADTLNTYQYLYYSPHSASDKPYRIPAIATAKNGDIFAISDYRPCGNDIGYGEVDMKCRISKDNGSTWGKEFTIGDGLGDDNGGEVWKTGFGDAAIVADRERNELLVMAVCGKTVCWNGCYIPHSPQSNPNRVAQMRAVFNNSTNEWEWSEPIEVTESIYSIFVAPNGIPTVQTLFIGSGRICQSRIVKKGDYYRLYCAVWTHLYNTGGNRVIYSDDFGKTWNVLGRLNDRPAPRGDEPKCEELPDGSVVLSSRKGNGRYFNIFRFNDNTYTNGTWDNVVASDNANGGIKVGGNSTNGEILFYKGATDSVGNKVDIMLQSLPAGESRSHVTMYYKAIDPSQQYNVATFSENWSKGMEISHRGSAYSTMTIQSDGRIGFFYEEEPHQYNMVYVPLTIEQLTNGVYKGIND